VKTINAVATFGLLPEVTFLIDVPIDEIIERRHTSGIAIDRMESGGREFYEKVREGYLELAKEEPKRVELIDGSLPVDIVQDEIWKILSVTASVENVLTRILFDERNKNHTCLSQRREDLVLKINLRFCVWRSHRDCVKNPLRCHPRESGDPNPANINWIPTFVGMTKPEVLGFYTVSIPLGFA